MTILYRVALIVLALHSYLAFSYILRSIRFPTKMRLKDSRNLLKMNMDMNMDSFSVSSSSKSSGSPKAFIISPTTQAGLDELLILQNFNQIQAGEQTKIGIIGSQDLSDGHSQMIELLSYALILSGNQVFTSGGEKGTNIAVIRGALRACNTDLLTVILPQSLFMQPVDMQPLLLRVSNLIEQPQNDGLDLREAAAKCNEQILSHVQKCIIFSYHNSSTILASVEQSGNNVERIMFYLD